MGYRGGASHYTDRDKEFERSFQEKPGNKLQVKKKLESLFQPKPKEESNVNGCDTGNHTWTRGPDGVVRCGHCKSLKPIAKIRS